MDEHELGSESIILVDVRVLHYDVPDYNLNIFPVGVMLFLLFVLKGEFFR